MTAKIFADVVEHLEELEHRYRVAKRQFHYLVVDLKRFVLHWASWLAAVMLWG